MVCNNSLKCGSIISSLFSSVCLRGFVNEEQCLMETLTERENIVSVFACVYLQS